MLKLMMAVFTVSLLLACTQPVMAQDEPPAAAGAMSMQGQDEDAGMGMDMAAMGMGEDPDMGMMAGMDDPKGMTCSPGCRCEMCMKKKMGMGMMGMGMKGKMGMMGMKGGMAGMAGMHGDIDMMTWPKMHKSCRLPDYYLRHKDELSLSDEQVDSLQKAMVDVRKAAILKGAQVKVLEMDLSDMVTKPDFKLQDAMGKLKEVEDARVELRSTMLKASAAARDSLTPEQLKKLKDITRSRMGGGCCGKCKSMEKNEVKGGVPEDMKKQMMEKMMREQMGQ